MAAPGQYTFPFSFNLPEGLPASLVYTGPDKLYAMIKYSIKAILEPTFGLSIVKMKHKQSLVIRQPANTVQGRTQTDTRPVYACCCFGNKGNVTITTQFEKDAYEPNETCRAMADLNNSQCTADCKSLDMVLRRTLRLTDEKGQIFTDHKILETKPTQGLGAGESTGGLNRYLELNLANFSNRVYEWESGRTLTADDDFFAR